MVALPAWQASTSGSPPLAAHINQFLGTHPFQVLYQATLQSSQTTAGTGNVNTSGNTWLAQSFTTGASQTAIGYVTAQILDTTGSGVLLSPTSLSLYTNSAGAPGTAITTTTLTAEYVNFGPTSLPIPLPTTGLTASTTYWLVLKGVATAGQNYFWNKSNQVSGASTSTNGTTWTAQAYGFLYSVFDQTAVAGALPVHTWEDSGARWSTLGYNTNGTVGRISEYTVGQTSSGYLQSVRTLTYSGNTFVTGVA